LTRLESVAFWTAVSVASMGVVPLYLLIFWLLFQIGHFAASFDPHPRYVSRRQRLRLASFLPPKNPVENSPSNCG
jgi:hypothetical protein